MTVYIRDVDITSDGRVVVSGDLSATNLSVSLCRLEYFMRPSDGIWGYDIAETATGISGAHMMVPFLISAPAPSDAEMQGVRIHNPSPPGHGSAQIVRLTAKRVSKFATESNGQAHVAGAAARDGLLIIDVSYTGGMEHAFELEWDGATLESKPPRYRTNLVDVSPADPCKAIRSTQLRFDINTHLVRLDAPSVILLSVCPLIERTMEVPVPSARRP